MIKETIDIDLLQDFEAGLDPQPPERSRIPARIIGYGEISTIFEINRNFLDNFAFKRMPIFLTTEEIDQYEKLYREYNRLINDDIGINVPENTSLRVIPEKGNLVVYLVQQKLPAQFIGNRIIKVLDDNSIIELVMLILREMKKVWVFNELVTGWKLYCV